MPDPIGPIQIARLEECVASDPGAPAFAAFSEALRRAGRLQEAEDVARRGLAHKPGSLAGSLVLALVLLDQDRADEARALLLTRTAESLEALGIETIPAASEPPGAAVDFAAEVTDGELERAWAAAEPDRDQLMDADRMAQEAMRGAELDGPEPEPAAIPDQIFATRTMAELLEDQGDSAGAARIRGVLGAGEGAEAPASRRSAERQRIIATLETWLSHLRRGPE